MKEISIHRSGVIFGLLAAMVFVGCDNEATNDQIAKVDGTPITENQAAYWLSRQVDLDALVQRTALVNQARHLGLDQDQDFIAEVESLLIARLKEAELQPKLAALSVSDEEVKAYFLANQSKYADPGAQDIAVLWLNTRGQEALEARHVSRLEEVRKLASELSVAEGFGTHAITHSEHRASRFKGGKLGWIANESTDDTWRSTIISLAAALEPGECSSIHTSEEGLFLVRLLGREAAGSLSFASVKARITQMLLREKRQQVKADFLATYGTPKSVTWHNDSGQTIPVVVSTALLDSSSTSLSCK